jgi:hypothetical protein
MLCGESSHGAVVHLLPFAARLLYTTRWRNHCLKRGGLATLAFHLSESRDTTR